LRIARGLFFCLLAPVPGALAQNAIINPGFEDGLNLWTIAPSPFATVNFDFLQGNVTPGAVSADAPDQGGPIDIFVVRQCVPAKGATTYDVGGSFRHPASVAVVPVGSVLVGHYSDSACTVPVMGSGLSDFGLSSGASPAEVWQTQNYKRGFTTPVGTNAVLITLRLRTTAAGATLGWFDDISLVRSSLLFYTIPPCRVIDTRDVGAPIGGPALLGSEPRTFTITGKCGLPLGARAVTVNLTATQAERPGNIRMYAGDAGLPGSSNVNYDIGQTRANDAVLPVDQNGRVAAFASQDAGSAVHLILDVNGYFQ
jgi:hypothetical protein